MARKILIHVLQTASLAVDLLPFAIGLLTQVVGLLNQATEFIVGLLRQVAEQVSIRDDFRDILIAYNVAQPPPPTHDTSAGENTGDVEASDLPPYTVCSYSKFMRVMLTLTASPSYMMLTKVNLVRKRTPSQPRNNTHGRDVIPVQGLFIIIT